VGIYPGGSSGAGYRALRLLRQDYHVPESPILCEIGRKLFYACTYIILSIVYYRLYGDEGEIATQDPIKSEDGDILSLGRIDNNLVPPPHTVDSIIRCISYAERFSYDFWHQLFNSIASKSALGSEMILNVEGDSSGSAPERPFVFVKASGMTKRILTTYNGQ